MDHEPVICPQCGNVIPISDAARSYGYMVVGLRILDHLESCNKERAETRSPSTSPNPANWR